jgi:hypothetical protein
MRGVVKSVARGCVVLEEQMAVGVLFVAPEAKRIAPLRALAPSEEIVARAHRRDRARHHEQSRPLLEHKAMSSAEQAKPFGRTRLGSRPAVGATAIFASTRRWEAAHHRRRR